MPKHTHTDDFHHYETDSNGKIIPRLPNISKTERDALTKKDGLMIYNTTDKQIDACLNGVWVKVI